MRNLLIVLLILFFSISVLAQDNFDERLKNLVLRAKVLETNLDKSDEKYPRVRIKLEVTFTNEGYESIIILPSFVEFKKNREFMFSCGMGIY